jgi:monofunctional biosynthetic peptidoglycan transglycosylase
VGEDIDFFSHRGFDFAEIRNALVEAWQERSMPRGASTISQQTAKNLWLSPSVDPIRKLREMLLTRALEQKLGKRRILEIYLNIAEFGPGVYGAEAASQRYFGKPASTLGTSEAAQLAAGLPRPSQWHPGCATRSYQRRVRLVLRRMEKAGFLKGEL